MMFFVVLELMKMEIIANFLRYFDEKIVIFEVVMEVHGSVLVIILLVKKMVFCVIVVGLTCLYLLVSSEVLGGNRFDGVKAVLVSVSGGLDCWNFFLVRWIVVR
jgi:hypothetical protein